MTMLVRAVALVAASLIASSGDAAEIVVSAAASLTNAFRDIGVAFERAQGGTTVAFNFAATDVLLAQIVKGAPADVFAAADEESMDRAERENLLLTGTRRDFAANRLVLIVAANSPRIASLAELTDSRFRRIAIGTPRTVPAGRYAKDALDDAKLWQRVEPRLVFGTNVRQVLDYVARGEVDAGFVYATDAAIVGDKVTIALDVPTARHVRYPVAVLRSTMHAAEAEALAQFLTTDVARNILVAHGFRLP